MKVRPRDRFAAEVHLTPTTVSAYAHNIGDLNPVHHDPAYAATTRYQRPIASGAHTTGLLMGLTATHFSQDTAMVGLEFWFRFRRPIFADETIRLEWLVIAVRPNAQLPVFSANNPPVHVPGKGPQSLAGAPPRGDAKGRSGC
jgi:3-hydroxybutyryl-CoA dehydratase